MTSDKKRNGLAEIVIGIGFGLFVGGVLILIVTLLQRPAAPSPYLTPAAAAYYPGTAYPPATYAAPAYGPPVSTPLPAVPINAPTEWAAPDTTVTDPVAPDSESASPTNPVPADFEQPVSR